MPPPPPSPLITEVQPAGPQPGVQPKEDWYPNLCENGIAFRMTVPDGDKGLTLATYVCIDLNKGIPPLEGTLGLGYPIESNPLHTRPDAYPQLVITDVQLQAFRRGEAYMLLVNAALAADGDASLQAEVYRYRASTEQVTCLAQQVVQARQDLHCERRCPQNSA